MAPIEILEHMHTYGNHPVACATALKNLEIMEREDLIARADEVGRYFLKALSRLEEHPSVGQVRGRGLWLGLDFTADKKTRALLPMDRLASLVARAKSKGLIIKQMGPAIELAPPLIIREEDIDRAVRILEECITEEEKDMGL